MRAVCSAKFHVGISLCEASLLLAGTNAPGLIGSWQRAQVRANTRQQRSNCEHPDAPRTLWPCARAPGCLTHRCRDSDKLQMACCRRMCCLQAQCTRSAQCWVLTLAAATASGPMASLYSRGEASCLPVALSTSMAVADVPSKATPATCSLSSEGTSDMRPYSALLAHLMDTVLTVILGGVGRLACVPSMSHRI